MEGQQSAQVVSAVQQVIDAAAKQILTPGPKPWYKRSELWLSAMGSALLGVQAWATMAPPTTGTLVSAGLPLVAYILSRGLAKFGTQN